MKLERATTDQVAAHIQRAAGIDLPDILREIRQGISEAWRVNDGAAWMVTRIERTQAGKELVIVCLEGRGFDVIAPGIIELAKRGGFQSIRAHAQRRGLFRMYERHGLTEAERVYRVTFDGRTE